MRPQRPVQGFVVATGIPESLGPGATSEVIGWGVLRWCSACSQLGESVARLGARLYGAIRTLIPSPPPQPISEH